MITITYKKPCEIIKLDRYTGKINTPTLLLMSRSFHILGKINRYENWQISLVGNGVDEITFEVHKYADGILCPVWNDLIDLKIVNVDGFGMFEISVDYTDNTETVKSIHGFSLETELAQINLHEFHVNDDEAADMVITEYSKDNYKDGKFIPTVFYNPDDVEHSLLHRVLADKAPHWRIGYVTPYIALGEDVQPEESSKFQRTYTVDGDSIYDFLTGTVAEESNVIFVFNVSKNETSGKFERTINCYSLCDCINQEDGKVLRKGIGEDTFVFVSKTKLANEITISSNKDNVKNCFRIEGGDDVITDMVRAVNMNGSNYIYQFANFQYDDMSETLRIKIKAYQEMMSSSTTQEEYYGENGIYTRLCHAYDDLAYYESSMMPNTDKVTDPGEAKVQYNKVVSALTKKNSYVAVSSMKDYSKDYFLGVTNNIEAYAQIFLDSRFDLEIVDGTTSYSYVKNAEAGTWTGKIRITQHTDETNVYPVDVSSSVFKLEIKVKDNELEFAKQKIEKALSSGSMLDIDFNVTEIWGKENLTDEEKEQEMRNYFNQYSLNRLKSFRDGYDSCLSVLMELGASSSGAKKELYKDYKKRYRIVNSCMKQLEKQVKKVKKSIKAIEEEQRIFKYGGEYNGKTYNPHDFVTYLGNDDLYKEFCSYRREDTYTNSNYISDGLSDSKCLEKAKELVEVATKEAKKACVLQRTVSTSLNNLFALPEFDKLYDKFALYNYIRVKTEDEILKLRLIGIDFSGDSPEKIEVTFSEQIESVDGTIDDLKSIIQQASSMATGYPSTALQAKQGSEAKNEVNDMYTNGLNAAKTMLTNNDNNEVTITPSGIICKRMDDEGYYGDKQLRITGNIMAFTTDNWETVEMAIGETTFKDPTDPKGEKEITAYGLLAPAIVGKFIVGESAYIGDENGYVQITGDGITIKKGLIQSENYKEETEEIEGSGSMINLTDGTFSFAGGGLTYRDEKLVLKNGMIQSANYEKDENGNAIDGSMIDLTNGNFSFAGGGLSYDGDDGDNKLQVKGDITAKSLNVIDCINMTNGKKTKTIMKGDFKSDPDSVDFPLWCTFNKNVGIKGELTVENEALIKKSFKVFGKTSLNNLEVTSSDNINISTSTGGHIELSSKGNDNSGSVVLSGTKFRPGSDYKGEMLLGTSDYRWKEMWCSQSSINSSSDRNLKNSIEYMDRQDKLDEFFLSLSPCTYKFNDGESGRTHFGFISQDVEQALSENNMSAYDFAGFCKDVKTETYIDEDGKERTKNVLSEDGEPEYIYSLRYGEFIALNTYMIQKLYKENQDLRKEIQILQQDNKKIKEKLEILE